MNVLLLFFIIIIIYVLSFYFKCSSDTMKKLLWKNQECDGVEKHVPKSWANAGVLLMARAERECSRRWVSDSHSNPISTKIVNVRLV
jgi:hypothetical protein